MTNGLEVKVQQGLCELYIKSWIPNLDSSTVFHSLIVVISWAHWLMNEKDLN